MKTPLPLLCLLLVACAAPLPPPALNGPTISVLPGKQSSFEQFLQDEQRCRRHAATQDNGARADEVAANAVVVGAATGAAAGALLGGNARAAANGAGLGVLVGVLSGQQAAQLSQQQRQERYNLAYRQCMLAKGHRSEAQASRAPPPFRPPPPWRLEVWPWAWPHRHAHP